MTTRNGSSCAGLPEARGVLAVVARPGDESYYLGGVLDAFRKGGAAVGVLCLTRGENSPYNDSMEPLETIRRFEFEVAMFVLRAEYRQLADFPDKALGEVPVAELAERVVRMIHECRADLLLTVNGRPGDPSAAEAASRAGQDLRIPVLAWTPPREMTNGPSPPIDFGVRVDRRVQRCAMRAHHSQGSGDEAHIARLTRQGDREWLRWLVRPAAETTGEAEET